MSGTVEIIPLTLRHGETVEMRRTAGGWVCPVCGADGLAAPAYSIETAQPSRAFCACCEVQFGWDDLVSSAAPQDAQQRKWTDLREVWLREAARADEAKVQLRDHLAMKIP